MFKVLSGYFLSTNFLALPKFSSAKFFKILDQIANLTLQSKGDKTNF